MTRYRAFSGAPTAHNWRNPSTSSRWLTLTSHQLEQPPEVFFPPSTLAAANRRISLLYGNVIFDRSLEDRDVSGYDSALIGDAPQDEGETTIITWPATTQASDDFACSRADLTHFRPCPGMSRMTTVRETQETQDTGSYNYSDASSIANFPSFHFNLHSLTPLSAPIGHVQGVRAGYASNRFLKVNLLAAVLEVDGPDSIRIKKGHDIGKEVSLLKLILGDDTGSICTVTAWRDVAEDWAGLNPNIPTPSVKKGDIVFLENVLGSWQAEASNDAATTLVTCSASPQLKSKLELCYRAMPSVSQDARYRPDLRLGLSDAAVRRVASMVKWFEGVAGLSRF